MGQGIGLGQSFPTCSSCLMVFSCWFWTFCCSRALDSSFQSLSFKPATQFSPREDNPNSSRLWACSVSTSCFSCDVSCSFSYRHQGGRDPESRDHTSPPPGSNLPSLPRPGNPGRTPCAPPRAAPWDSSHKQGWGPLWGNNTTAPRVRPPKCIKGAFAHLRTMHLPRWGLRHWGSETRCPETTRPGSKVSSRVKELWARSRNC